MILTSNYGLKKPEGADLINVEDFNANADMLDEKLAAVEAEMADVKKSVSDGDIAENIITFESRDAAEANVWTDVDVLVSGEKHKSILKKVSTMFKNVRYLYKMLGTTDISAIGAGTVTGAIASQNEALATVKNNQIKMAVGTVTISCRTYNGFLGKYIGGITVNFLTNFVNNCIVVPIEASCGGYEEGVCNISVNSNNWIRVNCTVPTDANVRCLILYK